MRTSRCMVIGAIGTVAALVLSACGGSTASSTDSQGAQTIGAPAGAGKTLTVWAMKGDLSPETLAAINATFTKTTGAKVDLQVQASWENITTKVTTALATSNPPDVFDLAIRRFPGTRRTVGCLT